MLLASALPLMIGPFAPQRTGGSTQKHRSTRDGLTTILVPAGAGLEVFQVCARHLNRRSTIRPMVATIGAREDACIGAFPGSGRQHVIDSDPKKRVNFVWPRRRPHSENAFCKSAQWAR